MTTRLRDRLSHGLFRDFTVDVFYRGDQEWIAKMYAELDAPLGWTSIRADFAERNTSGTWKVHCRGIWVGTQRTDPEPVARRELLGIDLWLLLGLGFLIGVAVGSLLH
jgi:hypothetical protein